MSWRRYMRDSWGLAERTDEVVMMVVMCVYFVLFRRIGDAGWWQDSVCAWLAVQPQLMKCCVCCVEIDVSQIWRRAMNMAWHWLLDMAPKQKLKLWCCMNLPTTCSERLFEESAISEKDRTHNRQVWGMVCVQVDECPSSHTLLYLHSPISNQLSKTPAQLPSITPTIIRSRSLSSFLGWSVTSRLDSGHWVKLCPSAVIMAVPTKSQQHTSANAFFSDPESTKSLRQLLKVLILLTIAGAAISSRLFSVISMFSHVCWSLWCHKMLT